MEELNTEEKFIWRWFSYLLIVIYLSIGCYKYHLEGLKILYWPLHGHDINREIVDVQEN